MSRFDYLLKLFETYQLNDSGMYAAWINIQGVWKLVVIDDQFPCLDDSIATSHCTGGVWVMMLEKCLANAYGSYAILHRGFVNFCLTDLTGAMTEVKDEGTASDWWDTLYSWFQRSFAMFAENDYQKKSDNPLKEGYSFAIIDLQEVENGEKIIQLKSPQIAKIFNGEWSNYSSKWTQPLRKKLKVNDIQSKDGTFWMNINELRQNFSMIGCCKVHDNYYQKWINIPSSKQNSHLVKFKIKESTHLYISLHQKDERILLQQSKESTYVPVRLLLAKVESSYATKIEFVSGVYEANREVYIEEYLEPHEYVLTIEVYHDQNNKDNQSVLQFYLGALPDSVELMESNEEDILEIQKNIIKNMALQHPQGTQKVRDYKSNKEPQIKCYNDMVFGLIYFYYVNNGSKKLREQITMTEMENIIIQYPFTNKQQFSINLQPNSDELVLYKYDPKGDNFSFKSQIKAALDDIQQGVERDQGIRMSVNKSRQQQINPTNQISALQNTKKYTKIDLLKFMRENTKGVKRVWNDKEINVFVHHFLHGEGVIILFLNYSDFTYEEYIVFELENLKIEVDSKTTHTEETVVRFILESYDHNIIFLNMVNKKDPYGFKIRSYYQYYEE